MNMFTSNFVAETTLNDRAIALDFLRVAGAARRRAAFHIDPYKRKIWTTAARHAIQKARWYRLLSA